MMLRWYTPVLAVLFATGAFGVPGQFLPGMISKASAQEKNDYNDEWRNVLGVVGFGQEHAPIDYSPRPVLAVPPNYDLPRPGSASAELPAGFPKDPDAEARRKAMLDPRRPVLPGDNPGVSVRNYLIEPPSEYLDASKVAATGHDAVGAPGEKPKDHHHHHYDQQQDQAAAAQTPPAAAPAPAAPH